MPDDVSNKARLEALESWVFKQNDNILELGDKLSQIESNETATEQSEHQRKNKDLRNNIQCETFGETFKRNCELEIHSKSNWIIILELYTLNTRRSLYA